MWLKRPGFVHNFLQPTLRAIFTPSLNGTALPLDLRNVDPRL